MTLESFVHWTGTAVAGMLCIGALMLVTYLVLGMLGNALWRRLNNLYDLYVLQYWMQVAKKNGRAIPRRADVEEYLNKEPK